MYTVPIGTVKKVGYIKGRYVMESYSFSVKTERNSKGNKLSGLLSQTLQAEGHNGSRWLKHVTSHPSA